MRKYFIVLFFTICSCINNSDKNKASTEDSLNIKENEILKRELILKDKDLELNKKELTIASKNDIPISELYKQVKTGVFIVYTQGSQNIIQGSGFFLNSSGIAVSNYHVFENADKAIVVLDNGEKYLISKIIDSNKDLDYVIFQVDSKMNPCYPLQISNEIPEIGSTCFAIGNPKGFTQTLSIGNISGMRDENKLIQTTSEITHGSSGGPLFNKYGKVIGITTGGIGEANLNFALNITKVPYQTYISATKIQTIENELIPTKSIESTIQTYYSTIKNEDYAALFKLYTPILDRFYGYFNCSNSEAVDKAKNYKKLFNIKTSKYEINQESFKITKLGDETYYVTFNMNYFIERFNKNKPKSFNLNIIMTITKDMKIKSIYEDIINSN